MLCLYISGYTMDANHLLYLSLCLRTEGVCGVLLPSMCVGNLRYHVQTLCCLFETCSQTRVQGYLKVLIHQSIPAVPIPSPPGWPPGIGIFRKWTGKCPTAGAKKMFKCPGVGAQKCFISFKKKLTVFANEMVIKRNDNVVRWKNVGCSNAPG